MTLATLVIRVHSPSRGYVMKGGLTASPFHPRYRSHEDGNTLPVRNGLACSSRRIAGLWTSSITVGVPKLTCDNFHSFALCTIFFTGQSRDDWNRSGHSPCERGPVSTASARGVHAGCRRLIIALETENLLSSAQWIGASLLWSDEPSPMTIDISNIRTAHPNLVIKASFDYLPPT